MSVISSHLLINLFARKRIFSIRLIIPLIFADPRWGTTKLDYRLSQHVLTGKQLAQPATELKKKHFNCERPYSYRNTYLLHKQNTCIRCMAHCGTLTTTFTSGPHRQPAIQTDHGYQE